MENALKWAPAVNDGEIGVSAKDGVVTLTGHVPSYFEKLEAERVVKRLYGVKAIANDLEVHLSGGSVRTDTDVAEAALNAFTWHVSVPHDKVMVTVRNGWITLDGEVDWQYQKTAAKDAVRYLTGVKGVTNAITLKPKVEPREVKERIEDALKRSALIDAKNIEVETSGHTVTLRGRVGSWDEREDAEDAAWAAPGVREVHDYV